MADLTNDQLVELKSNLDYCHGKDKPLGDACYADLQQLLAEHALFRLCSLACKDMVMELYALMQSQEMTAQELREGIARAAERMADKLKRAT